MMNILFIAFGGFIGAICRYAVTNFVKKGSTSHFPLGTFLVNITGSFLLGFLYGADVHPKLYSLLGTGFLGAFTTFSTFNLETVQLFGTRKKWLAFSYVALTYIGGILFAFFGFLSGR